MKLIVGLGNPDKEYVSTRHNLGFLVIDRLVREFNLKTRKSLKYNSEISKNNDISLFFSKPLTYVNNSGQTVKKIISENNILPGEILVICDDFSLPLGQVRMRLKGSSGGHNGLESIIAEINTEEFPRLRMGIGPVPEGMNPKDFVLGNFLGPEKNIVNEMVDNTVKIVLETIAIGPEKAMNIANRKNDNISKQDEVK